MCTYRPIGVRGRRAETSITDCGRRAEGPCARGVPVPKGRGFARREGFGAEAAFGVRELIYASLRGDQGVRRRRTARTSFPGRATIHETRARRRGGEKGANPPRS